MNGRKLTFFVSIAFIAGAMLMLFIRGAGTAKPEPEPVTTDAESMDGMDGSEHEGHEADSDHSDHQGDHAEMNEDEGMDHDSAAMDEGSGAVHGAADHVLGKDDQPATPAANTQPKAGDEANETVTMWVCEQDPSIGLSYADSCPLDGKPMVKKDVDLSSVNDLKNPNCPIMGGATNEDVYAIYKGTKVRFCCRACDEDFFSDAEKHIEELKQ